MAASAATAAGGRLRMKQKDSDRTRNDTICRFSFDRSLRAGKDRDFRRRFALPSESMLVPSESIGCFYASIGVVRVTGLPPGGEGSFWRGADIRRGAHVREGQLPTHAPQQKGPYSITSSARAITVGGMSTSSFAALR